MLAAVAFLEIPGLFVVAVVKGEDGGCLRDGEIQIERKTCNGRVSH